jgi:D-cysteine desulfhydrase
VAPGGSNGFGVLGYVSAIFELKAQIDQGLIPEPDFLFVAAGSGSTLVGLEIGKRLLNLKTKIIAVQTSDDLGVSPDRLLEMSRAAIEHLNAHLKNPIGFKLDASSFFILKDYLFGGHGQSSPKLERWISQFQELEPVTLDPVYTSKALYGMSDYLLKNNIQGKTVLFWNTASPYRKGDLPESFSWNKLSRCLKRWVREDQKQGRLAELGSI